MFAFVHRLTFGHNLVFHVTRVVSAGPIRFLELAWPVAYVPPAHFLHRPCVGSTNVLGDKKVKVHIKFESSISFYTF